MSEPLHEFERELAALTPARLPAGVTAAIAGELDRPARMSIADRVLTMFMGSGAVAAALIVGLVTSQVVEHRSPVPAPASPVVAKAEPASVGVLQAALARSNGPALELLR